MSGYKSRDLFGSGPHRFSVGKLGPLAVSNFALGIYDSGSTSLGLRETDVVVTGRLVSADDAGLRSLRDAIVAMLDHPPEPGTLIDTHGRSWPSMSFLLWDEASRIDRGRVRSLGYLAVFRRFIGGSPRAGGGEGS